MTISSVGVPGLNPWIAGAEVGRRAGIVTPIGAGSRFQASPALCLRRAGAGVAVGDDIVPGPASGVTRIPGDPRCDGKYPVRPLREGRDAAACARTIQERLFLFLLPGNP